MPLSAGTKLGPYEIESAIGAGGMGEVYKARDTRLDRTVAIKILPKHLSSNEQLRQRFDREAKVISNLSHANICALFDVGRENDIDYLVMEYLEGDTLAERLAKGSLPPEETLRLGMQIADALQAAHREGVVHRDLKPGNIMLTRGGVKLLDFGLAKSGDTGTESKAGLTALPTEAGSGDPLTQEGSILGTFQYMSPEQLEGKEADARSDIFALGAVLYEMASGEKAFEGDSQASLIAKIMTGEPRALSDLQPMSPPAFEQLVKACLIKDPEERIQTAHDVKIHLRWVLEGSSAAGVPAPVSSKRRVRSRLAWVLAGFFLLTTGILASEVTQLQEVEPAVIRATVLPPESGRFNLEVPNQAISPDGTMIAFVAADSSGVEHLWIRSLSSLTPELLPGTRDASLPFWSPDSRHVGFFADPKLMRITVAGQRRVQVVCNAASGRGGTWSKSDVILFCPASSGAMYQVPAAGGQATQVTSLDTTTTESAHRFPQFMPDGEHFIYVSIPGNNGSFETRFASLTEPSPKTLLTAQTAATYAHPGHLVFDRNGSLLAQPFDPVTGEIDGSPVPLPETPVGFRNYSGSPALSASHNGILAFPQTGYTDTQLEWMDRDGRNLGTVPIAPGDFSAPLLSPDGDRITVIKGDGTIGDIWIIELDRGISTRLTFSSSDASIAIWSTDGKKVYYGSTRGDSRNIYWRYANGAGKEELVSEIPGVFNAPTGISPDEKYMVVRSLRKETGEDLYLLDMDNPGVLTPLLNSPFNEMNGSISPDGKWLAYRSDESGRFEMYIQSFPTPTAKYRISNAGAGSLYSVGIPAIWVSEGSEIIYLGGDGYTAVSTSLTLGDEIQVGDTKILFKLPQGQAGFTSMDGQKFLACLVSRESVTSNLTVVSNWTGALSAN